MSPTENKLRHFESLVEIVSQLRGPQGCPWDKQQTHHSLTQYAIEETHELVEAIEAPPSPSQDQKIKEELGDVLFQVLLHSQLAAERKAFTLDDVLKTLAEKLVRRHPHVFGEEKIDDPNAVVKRWDEIKKQEASSEMSPYALNVPPLPALQRAYKIGKRTEKLRFDWNNAAEAMLKVDEEFAELKEALDSEVIAEIEYELGDVFFSLSQLARHLQLDPEQVLRKGNRRFETRFNKMIELAQSEGVDWSALDLEGKDVYWRKAKELLKKLPAQGIV